jgi:copper(I)-binding protein
MVSRSTKPLHRLVPAVAVGLAALLVGCSSGQVTQTDSIEPAVNGNRGDVGDIALRDVMLAYPESGEYAEHDDAPLVLTIVNTGGTDDELLSVSSPAAGDHELIGDTSLPARASLRVIVPDESARESTPETTESPVGGTSIPEESISTPNPPAETGEESAAPPPESDEPPSVSDTADSEATETPTSSPLEEVGMMSIVLIDLVQDLEIGRNVPVTFVFENAGRITINLPIASPATARQDPPETEEDSGH